MKPTVRQIKDALTRRDAPLYKGNLNLNIVGIRATCTHPDKFNDLICLLYQDSKGKWQLDSYPAATDPGTYYRENPIRVMGTAILKTGHYKSCWRWGKHRGRYDALVQRRNMTVYRDANRDDVLDLEGSTEHTGIFGINLHRTGNGHYGMVDKWSAGCQVIASLSDYTEFLYTVYHSKCIYGNNFSYTLIDEGDLYNET